MSRFYQLNADHVRLTPNGGGDRIDGVELDGGRDEQLKVRVSTAPEDGKANKALIALIAKALRRPKSSISIAAGDTSRKKILRIDGAPEEISAKLNYF